MRASGRAASGAPLLRSACVDRGPLLRCSQAKCRELTESVDNFAAAKRELEPKGMTVVEANVEAFRKVAQEKIWPAYKQQYGAMWDEVAGFKA